MTRGNAEAADYHIGVHDDAASVDAAAWDAVLARQAHPTPFLKHAFTAALQRSGSATPDAGWALQWLTVHRGDTLVGGVVTWLKGHSYGEYVFDWAWADAYRRHGLPYYPKLLAAVPFTPVPGTRLVAADDDVRAVLIEAMASLCRQGRLSSAHLLFPDAVDRDALEKAGWMIREGVQFHWRQDPEQPLQDFAGLLARLTRDKRKKIQQERRRVADAGVTFRILEGEAIGKADWDFFYQCYSMTYAAHHSTPYLSRAFFDEMARHLPQHWVMFVAERAGRPVASSLVAIDRQTGAAWGRYWGCIEAIDCLHFEACYYQPLQWCLAQGLQRFEGGAQGEHKMARGLLPSPTCSAHWLRDPRFADAVADFLAREGQGVSAYIDELRERSPFKDL